MSKFRQAAEQGLEALSLAFEKDLTYLSDNAMIARQDVVRGRLAVNALRAALAEPEQNTVTCVCGAVWEGDLMVHAPIQRKPLTEPELHEINPTWPAPGQHWEYEDVLAFVRAIEVKLKEKNT
jgi:hypothetical protein